MCPTAMTKSNNELCQTLIYSRAVLHCGCFVIVSIPRFQFVPFSVVTCIVNRCTQLWFLYLFTSIVTVMVRRTSISLRDSAGVCVCVACVCGSQLCEWASVMRNAYQVSTACQLGVISCCPNNPTGRRRVLLLIPNIPVFVPAISRRI